MTDSKGNTGSENTGNWNSGNRNSGHGNSGNRNSGDWNSGNRNSGNRNSGDWNSGNRNSGDWNSGNRNSGNRNSGDWNSGNRNSGDGNSGDWNSGNRNSGDGNSGHGNSGDRNSGWFNSDEPMARFFNKETSIKLSDFYNSDACPHWSEFYITKWIEESEMTDEEKKADPNFFVRGGYLKKFEYKEAWANFWRDTDEANRQKFLNLPNFDADIFLEITGIDVRKIEDEDVAKAIAFLESKGRIKEGKIIL